MLYKQIILDIALVVLVIMVTHTVFFMIYGQFVGGDAFIALKNFYSQVYNMRI